MDLLCSPKKTIQRPWDLLRTFRTITFYVDNTRYRWFPIIFAFVTYNWNMTIGASNMIGYYLGVVKFISMYLLRYPKKTIQRPWNFLRTA